MLQCFCPKILAEWKCSGKASFFCYWSSSAHPSQQLRNSQVQIAQLITNSAKSDWDGAPPPCFLPRTPMGRTGVDYLSMDFEYQG